MRCFIALPLPEDAVAALDTWTWSFRRALETVRMRRPEADMVEAADPRGGLPRLSWSRHEGYHLTLAFFGDIDGAAVESATAALGQFAGSGAISFGLEAPKGFPPRGPWRVLVAGVKDGGGSAELCAGLRAALMAEGVHPALRPSAQDRGRPFSPHVTLARAAGPRGLNPELALRAAASLPALATAEKGWTLRRCALFRSDLRPSGSVYTVLGVVEL